MLFRSTDDGGTSHSWSDVEADKLIDLLDKPDPDGLFGTITSINTAVHSTSAAIITWDRIKAVGSPTNNAPYLTNVKIFSPPTGGTASEFVLKTGDTMSGDLEIRKSPEAVLKLYGSQNTLTSSVATISFNSQKDATALFSGYLTYRTTGTANDGFFRFNRSLEIQGTLKTNSISTYTGDTTTFDKRLDFTNSSLVNARFMKGFVVKDSGQTIDGTNIFAAYNTHVEYVGPTTDANHIANKGYLDNNHVKGKFTITSSNGNYYIEPTP